MKKLIQICTILSLLVVFTAVSAFAQSGERIDAKIPFNFKIGDKSYKAGNYVIRVSKTAGGDVLSLEDENRNHLQTTVIARNGDLDLNQSELLFNRYENEVFLSKILVPGKGFSVHQSKSEKQIARQNQNNQDNRRTVAVNLDRK
jgi:hypothetical protein